MSYSNRLEDLIDHHMIDNEELIKRKRLGWVGYMVNGNLCFGIFDDKLIVRVGKSLAHALVQKEGIHPFEQADVTEGEVIAVESRLYENSEVLQKFLSTGIEYASGLPPKEDDIWSKK